MQEEIVAEKKSEETIREDEEKDDPHYCIELLITIYTIKNREASGRINQIEAKTMALYMTMRLNGKGYI